MAGYLRNQAGKGALQLIVMEKVNQEIDRMLHDAQHAESGANMAAMMHNKPKAVEFIAKRDRLIAEARLMHAANPGARWPDSEDCEWPAVKEKGL